MLSRGRVLFQEIPAAGAAGLTLLPRLPVALAVFFRFGQEITQFRRAVAVTVIHRAAGGLLLLLRGKTDLILLRLPFTVIVTHQPRGVLRLFVILAVDFIFTLRRVFRPKFQGIDQMRLCHRASFNRLKIKGSTGKRNVPEPCRITEARDGR
ncbi:hypothetical protein ESA_02985 [Cronobacter sakazakii ATCC BAA-894]|uniref:Uncharacterized protein n=1 Tax=Cronobacter sakazakii (strain ATCC BAA-894) TaxID=290339 RepID=A7MN66_CROS8|nr:hypothetical protein ESA_02985 [Cronobacter sakazakii ATCC BAA-894]